MELTERQERILKTIVELYIMTAHPVGSQAIVASSGLGVSSATVRHEMAVLEEAGYIRQLHTSGGRVPSNAGYRYYVERLMQPLHMSTSDAVTIRHQFHQAHTELQEWLKLTATVLAHRMHNVGLITAPKSPEVRLRHLEVISIQNAVVLLIVVFADGTVMQEMLPLPETHTQEELSALADRLSQSFKGLTATQIERKLVDLPPLDSAISGIAINLLRRGEGQYAQVFHAGLSDLISQPEFVEPRPGEPAAVFNERLRRVVDFLQQGVALQQLLAGLPVHSNVQIVIGGETPYSGLEDYSFVLGRYGDEDDSSGYLGVVGPTRMEYPRAVALVRYMTNLMTDLMQAY
jgi:heat-inducible transcriptional repressor